MNTRVALNRRTISESLIEIASHLPKLHDGRDMPDLILREARRVACADAGNLYMVHGDRLRFLSLQNDSVSLSSLADEILSQNLPATGESLAGFVAMTCLPQNIPDADCLSEDTPFRIDRRIDAATGYHIKTMLAIPLLAFDGECVGVMELINRIGPGGRIVPFQSPDESGVVSLASMGAVTMQNQVLQERLRRAHLDSILRLSIAAEFRDDDTGMHVRRMSKCSGILARTMGMSLRDSEYIEYASPMHDIGKIGIPDAILLKPSKLTGEERKLLETHTTIGGDILTNAENRLIATAHDVALTHHERWDGTGYPHGLKGEGIPLTGRVVGLADVFDALMSKRCYKQAFPPEEAIRIIHGERGKHFDPDVSDAFHDAIGEIIHVYEHVAEAES